MLKSQNGCDTDITPSQQQWRVKGEWMFKKRKQQQQQR